MRPGPFFNYRPGLPTYIYIMLSVIQSSLPDRRRSKSSLSFIHNTGGKWTFFPQKTTSAWRGTGEGEGTEGSVAGQRSWRSEGWVGKVSGLGRWDWSPSFVSVWYRLWSSWWSFMMLTSIWWLDWWETPETQLTSAFSGRWFREAHRFRRSPPLRKWTVGWFWRFLRGWQLLHQYNLPFEVVACFFFLFSGLLGDVPCCSGTQKEFGICRILYLCPFQIKSYDHNVFFLSLERNAENGLTDHPLF